MDWKVFLSTFSLIFVAELADKTQLAGMMMAAKSARPFSVWLGSVCAYIIVTAVSVIGAGLRKFISPEVLRYGGALLFILTGFLIFFGKI